MKSKVLFCVIAAAFGILCCFSFNARAEDEADRAALRQIRMNYMDAVNSGDLSKIAPYLSKDVIAVMVTGQEVKGFDELKAYWKEIQDLIGPGGSYHVTVNVDKTEIYNGNVEMSRGNTDDIVHLGNGKELRFNSFWTAICRKEDGVWKVIRMQASMNPVDNVFISLQLRRMQLLYGIGGVFVGAALTLAIQTLRSRARRKSASATR